MSVRVMAQVWDHSKFKEGTLLVLLAISDFADDQGVAYPSVDRLGRKARMSSRNVQLALRRLEKGGELTTKVGAGPRGCNLFRVMLASGVQLGLVGGEAKRTYPVKPTSPEPSIEPSVEPPKVVAASPQPFEVRTPAAEEKATAHEADVLWVAERSRKGINRFTDPKARANLRLSAKRALRHGVWEDIKTAILVHAHNPDSNPWYLDEWTRVAASQRREVESLNRKIAERAKDDDELRRHYARGAPKHIGQFIPSVLSEAGA